MKLIYIDESGDTEIISQGGSRWFVLTACMISEDDRGKLEDDLRYNKNGLERPPFDGRDLHRDHP